MGLIDAICKLRVLAIFIYWTGNKFHSDSMHSLTHVRLHLSVYIPAVPANLPGAEEAQFMPIDHYSDQGGRLGKRGERLICIAAVAAAYPLAYTNK